MLAPLVGEWEIRVDLPGAEDARARMVSEWMPGQQLLVQRSEVPDPAPDSLCVVTPTDDGFRQHYFDSRGVVRLYEMTFDGTTLTLSRTRPDFSPLDFDQRYVGCLSADGATIDGAWESREPGQDWRRDFGLTYRRTG